MHPGSLEDLGCIANLFPGNFGAFSALTGIATAQHARHLSELSDEGCRAAVLEQYAEYFGTRKAVDDCIWW